MYGFFYVMEIFYIERPLNMDDSAAGYSFPLR